MYKGRPSFQHANKRACALLLRLDNFCFSWSPPVSSNVDVSSCEYNGTFRFTDIHDYAFCAVRSGRMPFGDQEEAAGSFP